MDLPRSLHSTLDSIADKYAHWKATREANEPEPALQAYKDAEPCNSSWKYKGISYIISDEFILQPICN